MIYKFEINTDDLNDSDPESIKQTVNSFKMLIQFLCNSNPDYYLIGEMLKEQMEMQVSKINDIQEQINDTTPDVRDLKTILDRTINEWFYLRQEELGIKDGAEPFDSEIHTLEDALVDECEHVLEWQKSFVKTDDVPLGQFYSLFNKACCTHTGNVIITSYDLDKRCCNAPVEGFFEAWDSMVHAIKDRDREAVLYLGYKLHSLINTMDKSIYDYKNGAWIDDYINWYLEEVR